MISSGGPEVVPEPGDITYGAVLGSIKRRILGDYSTAKIMTREGKLFCGGGTFHVSKALLDTGASGGNYIGAGMLEGMEGLEREPCSHLVTLGDGVTQLHLTECVTIEVALYDDRGCLCPSVYTEFFVMPRLGREIIIGLPDILGNYYEYFTDILDRARLRRPATRVERLYNIYGLCKEIMCEEMSGDDADRLKTRGRAGVRVQLEAEQNIGVNVGQDGLLSLQMEERTIELPRLGHGRLKEYAEEARKIGSWYGKHKLRVLSDGGRKEVFIPDPDGANVAVVTSKRYGTVLQDDSVERLCEMIQELQDFPAGAVLDAWKNPIEECAEERDTPDPLSFGEDILRYMEVSVEESRREYLELLDKQISPEMKRLVPRVMDIMTSPAALETFAPSSWNGLKIDPVDFEVLPGMPEEMPVKARPIRSDLYVHAKKEFDRLAQYFYETNRDKCNSPIASPLVIAPKATAPFIRFCGDYRQINQYISIPKHPIPVVQHELTKAARYKIYVDLDMTNSFHQIPLTEKASKLLSVQTQWGLVRPKFLPEGVGPASGLLQSIVREIFNYEDFADWTIVIFDNFLVLADDYEDAANKLERVINRCAEFGVVLKIKKSFIGVEKVTFFGYEVSQGKWKLSDSRKEAIEALPFPKSKKEMQSFLGAALFFHNHIPDYSEWSAVLYEMTHDGFSWDPGTWKKDYKSHFDRFKQCIKEACTLHFPRYDLPWIIRCDASEHAVGAILFQVLTNDDGSVEHQPIAFASKRFSDPARNWDTYKREAFAIFFAVQSFSWYLRGKEFLVETDHRNLQWIETSLAPIVCRWRALLQAYTFKIRHIPGRENKVADWMSRPHFEADPKKQVNPISSLKVLIGACQTSNSNNGTKGSSLHNLNADSAANSERTVDSILQEVHGGRSMHYGAHYTWLRAKLRYPQAKISIRTVLDYVQMCPMCQKTKRHTGIKGLKGQTLSLKPASYRRTVGADLTTVTPVDKHGNSCVILVVEHFSHFPVAYPAKDYSAETVALALFKHYCTHGTFDQLASDPGSAFMSEVVRQLNKWLGVLHKVSLVGRHESNGCEGSSQQFLRHLRALVLDERLYDSWSDDRVLPLINLHLASYPTEETGGYTPLQLKYGTLDAKHFILPNDLILEPGVRATALIKALDENLRIIRTISHDLQQQLAAERSAKDKSISQYEPGDLVLFNPREQPTDHLETKLHPNWLGPFEVVRQVKNDVTAKHIVLNTEATMHVERLKPFYGTYEQALSIARHDQHQFKVLTFNYYTGNPFVRTSMTFNVTFEDGTIDVPYGGDFIHTRQFEKFIMDTPELFPLRFSAKTAIQKIYQIEKLAITTVQPNMEAILNLRIYDGRRSTWYDGCNLPDKDKTYAVKIRFTSWANSNHRVIIAVVPFFPTTHPKYTLWLTAYDIQAYVYLDDIPYWTTKILTNNDRTFPQLLAT